MSSVRVLRVAKEILPRNQDGIRIRTTWSRCPSISLLLISIRCVCYVITGFYIFFFSISKYRFSAIEISICRYLFVSIEVLIFEYPCLYLSSKRREPILCAYDLRISNTADRKSYNSRDQRDCFKLRVIACT